MRILWQKHNDKKKYDITEFISTVTWSGSATQASRSLQVSVLYSPLDKNIQDLNIKMGDRLILSDDGKVLINSMVYSRERTSEQGTITYSGYDDFNHLLKSNATYVFKKTTPENIVEKLCKDFQIDTGDIEKTKVPIAKLLIEGDNIYNIIMKAYSRAYKAKGIKYMPIMYGTKLYVIRKGQKIKDFNLSDTLNITSSSYSESIDSIINKVKIYNDKKEQKGVVTEETSVKKYGIFQESYTIEDGVNSVTAAKNMLVKEEKTASVEALGHTSCISGYAVDISDSITGLKKEFWIENDTHTWSGGTYTMSLELAFKNVMDVQEES
ncbi:XkdQ/YqbQ family protein [Anaeromicropila herbilytica]|uniref:YqbQ/XkdQ domain-containing protein n=1 Tax=Anaeromicropila herbilytica TaxID=2785025 RepID=A0A7R7EN81_9FIRM|nr:hypothetical protein [Anaeromicropila herbilytica]BCN32065.1 hypothetical protein bsdtb5_33600 [Anaeromicropila herbilytica]